MQRHPGLASFGLRERLALPRRPGWLPQTRRGRGRHRRVGGGGPLRRPGNGTVGGGEEVGCGSWVLEAVCGREPKGETELIIRWRFQISSSCCEAPGLGHRDVCHSSHVCSSAGARSHGRERMAVTEKRVEMVKSICIGTSGGFIRFSCRVCDIKIKKASCYTF